MCIYYTAYIITNQITGKKYAGVHKTSKLEDGYLGSGHLLKQAINKYGRENFKKTIVEIFETADAMWAWEKEFVSQSIVDNPMWYNINLGGSGGFTSEMAKKGVETQKRNGNRNCNNPETVKKQLESRKKNGTMNSRTPEQIANGVETRKKNGTTQRTLETRKRISKSRREKRIQLSEEVKRKISDKLKGRILPKESIQQGIETRKKNGSIYRTSETRKKIGDKSRNRTRVQCEQCYQIFDIAMYSRWHGDKCSKNK
jgi:hypothetical protein